MSTKSSIKWNRAEGDKPGYHLYTDVMDSFDHGEEPPVYLELNGVAVELFTTEGGAHVTVTIPHSIAVALGLLPSPQAIARGKQGL